MRNNTRSLKCATQTKHDRAVLQSNWNKRKGLIIRNLTTSYLWQFYSQPPLCPEPTLTDLPFLGSRTALDYASIVFYGSFRRTAVTDYPTGLAYRAKYSCRKHAQSLQCISNATKITTGNSSLTTVSYVIWSVSSPRP